VHGLPRARYFKIAELNSLVTCVARPIMSSQAFTDDCDFAAQRRMLLPFSRVFCRSRTDAAVAVDVAKRWSRKSLIISTRFAIEHFCFPHIYFHVKRHVLETLVNRSNLKQEQNYSRFQLPRRRCFSHCCAIRLFLAKVTPSCGRGTSCSNTGAANLFSASGAI